MFRLSGIIDYLSNIEKLFKFMKGLINNLKSSMVKFLLIVKQIPFDIKNSSWIRTIISLFGKK